MQWSTLGYPGFAGDAGQTASRTRQAFPAWGVAILLGLTGCAGAQAPTAAERQAGEAASVVLAAPAAGAAAPARAPEPAPPAVQASPPVSVPPAARQAVLDAYDAVQKRRWSDLDRLAPLAAADPVLGLYPRYWALRNQLQNRARPVPDDEVRQFLADSAGTYLNERIRSDWILASARAGNYAQALQVPAVADPFSSVRCALLLSRHQTGKHARSAEVLDVFQPNADCWDLLDQAAADHVLSRKELNGLLRDILETGKQGHADRMAGVVFDDTAVVQYAALMKNPRKWLESRGQPRAAVDFELAAIALSRLARSDDRAEAARYIQERWAGWMPKADLQWVWGQFGLVAALNVDPEAARWYRQSGFVPMTDYNHAWEVRAELRAAPIDWGRVATAIRKMSARQADEPVWRYWYGRSLAAQGNTEAARQYYESIVGDQGFYGLLAAEELGRTPALPAQPGPLDPAWVAQARANPGLQRAVALFDLGWRREAVPEWNFALRGMSDAQLRGAAEFAREEHIYDRVVNTSQLTQDVADFSQRFIAPFEGQVAAKARLIDLDPAWVYGLIRQESRFITDARSRVGASGLMQLMPATARHVARKIGMKDFKPSQVNDFDTNTILGTHYLNMVLQDLNGSELLATAGYNAGPGRPKRWRAQLLAPVEGAIFAETIPFTETRLYVKNVLSNAVYYAMMFSGQPDSLKTRLGTVSPLSGTRTARP
ncbi:lytic transglycosylase domain-containing protein [Castellaniella ginsengisoli]|uniref:Lytic transglycosylase domain-containing protein n=1 Tax=Castellaniella ginsengisoli TaxID=546114 RepID=A0ABP3W8U8_9BURK